MLIMINNNNLALGSQYANAKSRQDYSYLSAVSQNTLNNSKNGK